MRINVLIFVLLIFSLLCLFYGVFRIAQAENTFRVTVYAVKSLLQQSERGVTTVPVPDYHLVIVFFRIFIVSRNCFGLPDRRVT
jgi:ABC-type uncharacterized transport system permease subunit